MAVLLNSFWFKRARRRVSLRPTGHVESRPALAQYRPESRRCRGREGKLWRAKGGARTTRTTCVDCAPPTDAEGRARLEPSAQWLTDIVSPRRVCCCTRRGEGGRLLCVGRKKRLLYSYVRFA